MIIEAKPTLPSVSQITVPFNYVLVKMEPRYQTYQMKGRETNILANEFIYDKDTQVRIDERLVSPFGTVVKTPLNLVFNGREIKRLADKYEPIRYNGFVDEYGDRQKHIVDYGVVRRIADLKKASLNYDTDMEVRVGDRVHVNYLHYLNAEKEGLFIDSQEGQLVMIKYDLLKMVVDADNTPIRALNGYILIEPKQYEVDTVKENGAEFIQHESGLVLLNPEKKKTRRNRKNQLGTVLLAGSPLKGYMDNPDKVDRETYYQKGAKILYDPRLATKLENDLHQVISEKDLYLIRREAIILDENEGFDLDKIEI